MSRVQAMQVFRSCASSFSSRHVARTSVNAPSRRLPRHGVRCYSAQTSSEEKKGEDGERAEESEKDEVTVTPEHELLAKLKKKEGEVTDLMVSPRVRPQYEPACSDVVVGPLALPPSRLPQPPA